MAVGDLALADLRAHPILWLQSNALVIWGLSKTGSSAQQFRLFKTDKKWRSVVGGDSRDVPYWTMYATQQCQGNVAQGDYTTGSAPFDVHYVSMREFKNGQWEDANTTHYMLPAGSGADMMVTSKLNGCTFGIGSDAGGGRLVSHLRPPNINPTTDAQEVSRGTEAGFTSYGVAIDYRVMSTGDYQGTVLGLRLAPATSWTFYTQRYHFTTSALPGVPAGGMIDAVSKLS